MFIYVLICLHVSSPFFIDQKTKADFDGFGLSYFYLNFSLPLAFDLYQKPITARYRNGISHVQAKNDSKRKKM